LLLFAGSGGGGSLLRPRQRCPVRLSDSTIEFPIIKTTKLLVRNSFIYMSKANLPIAVH